MFSSISIVIRTFNEEKFIGELLTSITSQQGVPHPEVIVVDSESTDGTLSLVQKFENLKIVSISKSEFTFGRALNIGAQAASGDIVVSVSAHCIPLNQDWLAQLIEPFQNKEVALVYGKQIGINEKWENHPSTRFSERRIFNQHYPDGLAPKQTAPFLNNANGAFRKTVWNQIHFNEHLTGLEDLDFAIKAAQLGFTCVYAPAATVIHLHDENNARVFNRFFREELALKNIDPVKFKKHRRSIFLELFKETALDLSSALKTKGGLKRFYISIFGYRLAQYFAIYLAHNRDAFFYRAFEGSHDAFLRWVTRNRCSLESIKLRYQEHWESSAQSGAVSK